jgi:polyvinyl alcohol dehydrogenase (cytochrome)
MSPANHFDSIIALDLHTGAIKWAAKGLAYDAWNVGCGLNIPGVFTVLPNDNCPAPMGPDWDFSQGPMLFGGSDDDDDERAGKGKGKDKDKDKDDGDRDLVGAGQKSGMFWAFKADNGALAWSTQAAPPGLTGGLQWGSATNGKRIWFAAANSGLTGAGTTPLPWKQSDGTTTTAGGWGMLNANSGKTMWTTREPFGNRAEAAVSAANGVVFGCSLAGNMYALDAKKGDVLWTYPTGRPCNAGPSVADGMVFWGSGTFNNDGAKKVFAFGL